MDNQPPENSRNETIGGRLRSRQLVSSSRVVYTYGLALCIILIDMFVFELFGINTPTELMIETLIHGTGLYLGFTLVALFNRPY